ncbi:MAG: manganese efflux pump [Alphaproteobacteria bacterium]|nr:MAG: manganese efflux pump [Alphaproteobacteria bacterium]
MAALFLLALALSMDAFAVALCQGAAGGGTRAALRAGAAFGLAQGLMPLVGWSLGIAFAASIAAVDHWIALILLSILGLKMIHEGATAEHENGRPLLSGWALFAAAIATSIDAAAAGITLPTIGAPILAAVAAIGATTAIMSFAAVLIGRAAGDRLGKWAEIAGGLMLIGIGARIFVQHQFPGG